MLQHPRNGGRRSVEQRTPTHNLLAPASRHAQLRRSRPVGCTAPVANRRGLAAAKTGPLDSTLGSQGPWGLPESTRCTCHRRRGRKNRTDRLNVRRGLADPLAVSTFQLQLRIYYRGRGSRLTFHRGRLRRCCSATGVQGTSESPQRRTSLSSCQIAGLRALPSAQLCAVCWYLQAGRCVAGWYGA